MMKPKEDTIETGLFRFELESECACPGVCSERSKNHGLSTGSLLLILLFVFVIVYLIGGFMLLKFYFKKEGKEAIPQYEFWADFPAKVKDGFVFVKEKATSNRNGEYEKI